MTKNEFITNEIVNGNDLNGAEKAWRESEHFGKGKVGFTTIFRDELIADPFMSDERVEELLSEYGTESQQQGKAGAKAYIENFRHVARSIANNLS